jgi:hypothetical protein
MYRPADFYEKSIILDAMSEREISFGSQATQAESRFARGRQGFLHQLIEMDDRIFSSFSRS